MFFQELKQFIKTILSWIYLFIAFAGFFSFFGFKKIAFLGKDIFIPFLTPYSFSIHFFKAMQNDLVPEGVQLIATNPFDAFLSQIKISLILAFIFTFPFLIYKIIGYFSPAFYENERRMVFRILAFSFILFSGGCLFAYFLLVPLIFRTLYLYAPIMGIVPLFSINEFVGSVAGLMLASGIMFLLPVFMVLLSKLKIIGPDFWKKNWRYAILFFLITSAIITPDGSGISMLMLSLPLTGLYFLGWTVSR